MISLEEIQTPFYLCEEELLEKNLKILQYIQDKSGAKVILALKGFAMWSTFELVSKYLHGCTASGLHEAKLANEEFKKYNQDAEVHTYSPAFSENDIDEIASISDDIVFNSPAQLLKYAKRVKEINPNIKISLRINPEVSSSPKDIYNPCAIYSRLGTTLSNLMNNSKEMETVLEYLDGLNFHALCEQDADALQEVLVVFEENFSSFFSNLKYVNFGGGHHITKKGYDLEKLISLIQEFKGKYNLEVYLEPGEAVGWECGYLVSSVLDIVDNGMQIAILDTSAEAHMPDTLAMPYRADVRNSGLGGEKTYTYRLTGNTCLAGDVMGDYSFDKPLMVGDRVIFEDQMHYTFVKNTTFNGIKLPSLVVKRIDRSYEIVKEFGYEDYKMRLS